MRKQKLSGFTMIEMLLSVALISALAGMSFPIYQSFQNKNDMDVAVNSIAQSFRRAQILSQAMEGDSTWGLKIQSGSVVIFKGTSYATRDSAYDEIFDVPTTVSFSGLGETVFAKMTGMPSAAGTVTVSSTLTANETRALTLNARGMVEF